MKEQEARQIIRKNVNYTDSYSEMVDKGAESNEADHFWYSFQHECGHDSEKDITKKISNWRNFLTEELTPEMEAKLKENWIDENDCLVLHDGVVDYSNNFWQAWQCIFDDSILD
jgi:hypothetical protein